MTTPVRRGTLLSGNACSHVETASGGLTFSRRTLLSGGAAVALAASPLATMVKAQGVTDISMIGFGGVTNVPIWYAIDRGLFLKEGLNVKLDRTPGSKEQVADLMAGKYQFATTAFDNIVAYTEGQGTVKYDNFDLVAILGVHSGLNSVVTAPTVKTWSDIKGKTVSVDSPTSGYATVLYQILQDKGFAKDRDYKVISVGGTVARINSLVDGTAQMAIISSPEDIELKNKGFNILAEAAVEIGEFQGSTYAVRRGYAKANEKTVLAFIRAIRAAHDAVFKNKADTIALLKIRAPELSDQDIEIMYTRMTGPGGLNPGAAINVKGVETVLKLRSIYGSDKAPVQSPSKYIDTSYAQKA
jgi:ABC-type nitrate/sulfonate/bicarbonate transport system substrate-binding protein